MLSNEESQVIHFTHIKVSIKKYGFLASVCIPCFVSVAFVAQHYFRYVEYDVSFSTYMQVGWFPTSYSVETQNGFQLVRSRFRSFLSALIQGPLIQRVYRRMKVGRVEEQITYVNLSCCCLSYLLGQWLFKKTNQCS